MQYFGIGVIEELVAYLQPGLSKHRPLVAMLPVHLCEDCVPAILTSIVNDKNDICCRRGITFPKSYFLFIGDYSS